MGTMIFQLPPDLADAPRRELDRASVLGGQDHMPYLTQASVDGSHLLLHRSIHESGSVLAPWEVPGVGQLLVASACLMERLQPYQLLCELARGKINQVRNQIADWQMGGLLVPEPLAALIHKATHALSQAVTLNGSQSQRAAHAALGEAFEASGLLVKTYMDQVFQVRHQRQTRLETNVGCRVYPLTLVRPDADASQQAAFLSAFNTLVMPFPWSLLEAEEGSYLWAPYDDLVHWATQQQLTLVGGPLIDFSGRGLPDWLWRKGNDLVGLCNQLSEFVTRVISRYRGQIRTWQVTAGSNCAGVLALDDEELLWLTVRLIEAARKVDTHLELLIGVAQPLGDYLAQQERTHSPFGFVDTLLRTGLKLGGIELEIIMGVQPRGSYVRDPLDVSRGLDLYALLGLPVHLTLGYPSAREEDAHADADLRVPAGYWHDGFSLEVQADWARRFASLAICKPYVRSVSWSHWSDAGYHQFPSCGLVDASGQIKPALEVLTMMRAEHLK